MIASPLIHLTPTQSLILQLRARGATYRQITRAVKISPRKVHDAEIAALRKVVRYLEQETFLGGGK